MSTTLALLFASGEKSISELHEGEGRHTVVAIGVEVVFLDGFFINLRDELGESYLYIRVISRRGFHQ